jgi:hypothetical protein
MRFRKTIKLGPGVKINVSKSGISSSFGVKGLSVNIGKNGAYLNTGIPGTGISNRVKLDGKNQNATELENAENEVSEPLGLPDLNEYLEFKNKITAAGGKAGLASDKSYYELFHALPPAEKIIYATQYCGKGSLGAIAITEKDFYAINKNDNQKIILSLAGIKDVSIGGGLFKTNMIIKTDTENYTINSVVKLKETVNMLIKAVKIQNGKTN